MATTVGSGLGASAIAAAQAAYGGIPVFTAARTITFKTIKPTFRQHPVQGGPYIRAGQFVDLGSARELLWLDGMFTVTGDVCNIGHALLLASALGTLSTLTELGTTGAYALGGAAGAVIGMPDVNNTFGDWQYNVPTTDTTVHTFTWHSGMVLKAEWVFDRTGYTTYSYDYDFQTVETTTAMTAPTVPAAPIPFGMGGNTATFKIGAFGSEAAVTGVKKCTISLERKLATERIYLGNALKDAPVTNGLVDIKVALECDYEASAKTAIFDLQLAGTPVSIVASAVGSVIAGTYYNTFGLNATNCFVDTGGEPPIDGPDVVKNTINLSGTIDLAADPAFKATLITPDLTW